MQSDAKAGVEDVGYPEDGGLAADCGCAENHRKCMRWLPVRRVLLLGRACLSQVLLPEGANLCGIMRGMCQDHH
jgi:hypothetical protein